jgi:beta-lactamase class A
MGHFRKTSARSGLIAISMALLAFAAHADEIAAPNGYRSAGLGAYNAQWPPLIQSRDPWLQEQLRAKLKEIGLDRAAAERRLAVALVDITVIDKPRVAAVNAHEMMYAASLPKIAILLGAFQKAQDGDLELDAATRVLLTQMIRNSSNSAATTMLERVGYNYVANVLQSDRYDLYDEAMNGGLWVGKPYAKKGAWKRDPMYNLSHAATPFQVARFYYLLETGQLVSPTACTEMLEMLSRPAIQHKFVSGLNTHRPGSTIYRKSGTWRTYHSDSAVIERDGRRYIAVAMANHPSGSRWLSQVIVAMDDLIFDTINIDRDDAPAADLTMMVAPRTIAPAGG